ncbi:hypothetical protein SASPL_157577 [Salvia splendens]|uniref:F-box domain-containing protein n=1 Tax=Salvia splendens TaxID=180675 RepID=A0A8X8VUP3_SALSN|nr:hypothetical protein SASPL_157577 [Salvia splendens]
MALKEAMEEWHIDDSKPVNGCEDVDKFPNDPFGMEFRMDRDESYGGANMIIFVLQNIDFGLRELLSIERVCRSLRDAVQKDPYLWRRIFIPEPISNRISNEDLLRLTDRAKGKLRKLTLITCCNNITDGVKQVLERNLELTEEYHDVTISRRLAKGKALDDGELSGKRKSVVGVPAQAKRPQLRIKRTTHFFLRILKSLNERQKTAVRQLGFSGLLDFDVTSVPGTLAYRLLEHFDHLR